MATVCVNKAHPQQQNKYTESTFYMSFEHVFNVFAVLSHYAVQTTTPFTDALDERVDSTMLDNCSFVVSIHQRDETLMMVDRLLMGIPDGIISPTGF